MPSEKRRTICLSYAVKHLDLASKVLSLLMWALHMNSSPHSPDLKGTEVCGLQSLFLNCS
jgi:hypothetical protein